MHDGHIVTVHSTEVLPNTCWMSLWNMT